MRLWTILRIVAVVAVAGALMYFALAKEPQFKVGAELPRTHFEVGERISVKPYIINRRILPVTIFSCFPLFFVRVYDAENREVLQEPEIFLLILRSHTLWPHIRYYETVLLKKDETLTLNFTLEQPGRYKIVTVARFDLGRPGQGLHIYAEPIWIEVIPGPN